MPIEDIYSFLLSNSPLTPEHRQELTEKRGLSDASIEEDRFGSSGKHLADLEIKMIDQFKEEELITSGAFVYDGKSASINPMLLDERIIIPYLDLEGRPYHLRFCVPGPLRRKGSAKILGFSGIPIEIYQKKNLKGDPSEIILTEGEFKAAAGKQFGIAAIAIPGISSFSEQHFPRLIKELNEHRVKKIYIVFDNEVKDDSQFTERFKENPFDRYDTEFYAYYMAKKLENEGKEVRIAKLPDSWRENGKIDLDGAAAQLRTKGEIKKILFDAKHFREFLAELQDEPRNIILRKNAQKRHRSHIQKEFNHYVATRKRGKNEWYEPISNFVIKIVATHNTPEGMVREVLFVNEYGETSKSFSLTAADMARPDAFTAFCMGRGNFVWKGQKEDLFTIWESEFLMDDGRHITEPDHIGWVESEKMWLFGNIAFRGEGEEVRPDKNHVFWTGKKGLKPIPLGITSGKTVLAEGIPYLSLNPVDIHDVKNRLSETIGNNEANICLGWITAVAFLEEVFDAYSCFPFLNLTGRRGSGKSTVAEWIMNFFGLENAGKMASDTTQVGLQRYLSYYSSLPVFLDEFRNTKQIVMKTGFLRNAYNRQSAGKGIKADFGLREAKVRGTLLISGEETPEDNALLCRCIVVIITERNRRADHYQWFVTHRTRLSNYFLELLRRKHKVVKDYLRILNEAKNFFVENNVDDRTAINYAIITAGYAIAFGEKDVDFAKWISEETVRVKAEYQDEQAVSVFLEDLIAMKTRGIVNESYWDYEPQAKKIYLYFHGLYSIWSQEYRKTRGVEPFKASSIRDYLKEEQGFLGLGEVWRISGTIKKCIVFDAEKAPEIIKHLVEPWAGRVHA